VTDVTATLPAPDAPTAAAAPDGPIHVVSPFGVVGTVPASALGQAQREGYTLATPEQVAARREQEQYGGGVHALGAAGAGAARALTFGLSDVAMAEAGAQETLAAYRRVQPEATMLGEIGGTVAGLGGAAVAKGAGLAGQALRGAAAPTRAVLAAGEAVEAGAVAAGLGRVGGLTARAAAEGAAYGAAGAVTDAALGDHELTGERLFSAMGHGALLGGGAALGLAGMAGAAARAGRAGKAAVGRLLERASPSAIESVAERTYGYVPKGLGEAVAKAYRETAQLVTGAPREATETLLRTGAEGRAARKVAVYEAAGIKDAVARDLRVGLDDMLTRFDEVSAAAKGEMKAEQVARLVATGNEEAARLTTAKALVDTRQTLQAMLADPVGYGMAGRTKKLLARVQWHTERMGAENADAFVTLDRVKREIGQYRRSYQKTFERTGMHETRASGEALEQLYERQRMVLEDARVWGRAAEMQRALNAPWTEQIATNHEFRTAFTRRTEGVWGARKTIASDEKAVAYVNGLLNPTKDHAHQALAGWLKNTESFVQAAKTALDLTPAQLAAVERIGQVRAQLQTRVVDATDAITKSNQFRALIDADQQGALLGGLVGGGLVGGPAGMALGLAGSALMAPGATVRRIAALEALQERVAGSLEGRAVNWARGAERARRGIARITVPAVRIADEYDQRKRRVEAIAAAPRDALREQAAAMAPQAPQIQASALATADRAAQYLTTALPAAVSRGLGPPRPPSRDEMEKWLRKARVVEDPASVVRDLEAGRLSRDGVDALRTVYPARYAALQRDLMTALAEQAGSPGGIRMPYQDRLQLGLLLGMPTDATLDPELMRAVQATYTPAAEAEQQAASKPRPQKAPNVAGHYADESERLEREE